MRGLDIDTVFGNPGSTELPMFRDFPSDFRYVLGLQESVVVAMADGYAQATRNAALVNLHSAAGVGHAMGSIFTAFKNQTPLVITAGQQSRSILPYDPFLAASYATELPKPYVKWACEPARAEDVPQALARAYYIAMQPPRGPVLISIPADDWERKTDWVVPRKLSQQMAPDPELIQQLASGLSASLRPAIVVGAGVARDSAVDEVVQLATRHSAPVFVAPMSSRCSFPERHPLFAGFLPAIREQIVAKLSGYDFILVVGAPAFLYHVEGMGPHVPPDASVWQIVDDAQTAAWTPSGSAIVCSPRSALTHLLSLGSQSPQRNLGALRPVCMPAVPTSPMSAEFALQSLDQARGPDDVVVEEAPGTRPVMHQHLPMDGGDRFYTMASGGLGWSMPAAVGIALGRQKLGLPGRVIGLVGDGSSMYSIQALYTAVAHELPITFIVLNNHRYAAMQEFSKVFGYRPDEKPVGTDLPGLDFVLLATGQGMKAERIAEPTDLVHRLRRALDARGPYLVELDIA